ncbi:MAG: DUF3857 and transglutaminase domain-containing protein [Bacteroidales bacterium]|nr:DUF3857 and transglutaminase domain-containing protein [Bacteroidales bacterium]
MKRLCSFLLFCIAGTAILCGQEISFKYGKITNDELSMKVYARDTTAEAVVLYDEGYSYYVYTPENGFVLQTEFKKKIKILKPEGVDRANINISYYYGDGSDRDYINNLEAISYNLEAGKVVKTKLEKKYIFDEVLSETTKRLKFSIPNVKAGSVIEFKYTLVSRYVTNVPEWYFQSDIPVMNSKFGINILEYFNFNIRTKGYEHIAVTQKDESGQLRIGAGEMLAVSSKIMTYTATDVPAMKDEDNVWCMNEYKSAVVFELRGTQYPYQMYKSYTSTWKDIIDMLEKQNYFSSNNRMSNPFKDETAGLINGVTDEQEKVRKIYSFIKNKIKWNDVYSFYGGNPRTAAKEGVGNNAQINFVLMSALRDADIKCYPVLISRRSKGRFPITNPSVNKISTFIVAAELKDGKMIYMDGSSNHGGLNILPTDLLVDKGIVYDPKNPGKSVDLTNLVKNQFVSRVVATLDKDGNLKGERSSNYVNQFAYTYRASIAGKDSVKIVDAIQNNTNTKIESIKIEEKISEEGNVKETFTFTKNLESSGDYIYFNPMVFPHITENPFTQSERKLPIEFGFPYLYRVNCIIMIPEGYVIEEVPKGVRVSLLDNGGKCTYAVNVSGRTINLGYIFDMSQILYPFTDYEALKNYFGLIATKNSEMIVLKKI